MNNDEWVIDPTTAVYWRCPCGAHILLDGVDRAEVTETENNLTFPGQLESLTLTIRLRLDSTPAVIHRGECTG